MVGFCWQWSKPEFVNWLVCNLSVCLFGEFHGRLDSRKSEETVPMKCLLYIAVGILAGGGATPLLAGDIGSDRDTLRHYYRVFSDTCHLAPTALQAETLRVAEQIYQTTDGWPGVPDEELSRVVPEVAAHYEKLKATYPTYTVVFDDDATSMAEGAPALQLTAGLRSVVLVEVENKTASDIRVSAHLAESTLPASGVAAVGRGKSMPLLLPVLVEGDHAGDVTLVLTPEGNGESAGVFKIPAQVKPPALLRGTAIDTATGEAFPSRMYVTGPDGIYRHSLEVAGNTTLTEKQVVFRPAMQMVPFSYTSGEFTVRVPAGEVNVVLERGYETPLVSKSIHLEPGAEGEMTIGSQRAFDMKQRGWISGDTHIHWSINTWDENEDLDLLAMVQRAEDLRVANNLTLYQWTPQGAFLKPDHGPMGPVSDYCDGDYHIQMAEEYRNDNHYGHINLLNIKELIQPVATGPGSGGPEDTIDFPTNKTAIEEARRQGGISIEAHNLGPFHSSGVVANVILGYSDSLDQLEPRHYYNFLDSGVRIGLSNGSDHPARLAGICRVYVHAPGPLDYDAWCRRLAEGRTFTTSGPLLLLTANDGNVGDVIEVTKGDTVTVAVEAWSRHPLGRVEIVSNGGEVMKGIEIESGQTRVEMEWTADKPRWFAARASRNDSFDALSGPDIAHTSAIHFTIDGRGVFVPEAAQGWIENAQSHRARLVDQANFADDSQREEALEHIDAAIARYQQLIDEHDPQ
jgi:hypothetical protein